MAMDDGVLPFLRVENPAGNRKIILTLQQVKPLKRGLNFFLKLNTSTERSLFRSTDTARQHPFHTLLQDMLTAGMLRDGVGIHRQHDQPPQIRGLLSRTEERNRF